MNALKQRIIFFVFLFLLTINVFIWKTIYGFESKEMQISFFDVGQGDAILIKSPNGNKMLVDGGPDGVILERLGNELNFFDKNIDFLMVSNPDKDHISGLIDVLKRFNVGVVILPGTVSVTNTYQAFLDLVDKEKSKIFIARRGQVIDFGDGAFVDIIFPDRDVSSLETNTGSILAKLRYGSTSALLTGDLEGEVESYIGKVDNDFLKSDILKVAHHGSKTSSFLDFLTLVKPTYAVISSGKGQAGQSVAEQMLRENESFDQWLRRTANQKCDCAVHISILPREEPRSNAQGKPSER
jgi:competence protein ComEC